VNVNQGRFPRIGDNLYQSADYDAATNRIDLSVNTGMGGVNIP
jgi:hypothetical protein